jgi:hypothetical protein
MRCNLSTILRSFWLSTLLSGLVAVPLMAASIACCLNSSHALSAGDIEPIPAQFTCEQMGLDPNQRYPIVHGGGCIGQVPYRGVNLPNRTNCSVDRQYSCLVGGQTVCVRTINCDDGLGHDTSCDAAYRVY